MTKVKIDKTIKVPVNKIIHEYMVEANKTEMDKQIEEMTMQIEDNTIECQSIIAALTTSDLPTAILRKERKELELTRAKKAYEKTRFLPGTLANCVQKRNEAKKAISSARTGVAFAISAIAEVEQQIAEYQSVLEDLQATI
jgi:DNA repair exonuclease SbcCD ATPase subunit